MIAKNSFWLEKFDAMRFEENKVLWNQLVYSGQALVFSDIIKQNILKLITSQES